MLIKIANRFIQFRDYFDIQPQKSSSDILKAVEGLEYVDDLIENGSYSDAENEIDNLLLNNNNTAEILFLHICQSKINRLSGEFNKAIERLETINDRVTATNDDFLIASLSSELSWSLRLMGELRRSQFILNNLGKLLNTLKFTESNFVHKKILDYKANQLHNQAVILLEQEDIRLALDSAYESLVCRNEIGRKHGIADSINNIGVMHWYNGELDVAMEKFVEALELRKEGKNLVLRALVYLNLVQLNVQRGADYMTTAIEYFKEFETFSQNKGLNNQQVQNFYQFAKAVYLKSSNRFKDRVESEKIFYDLIEKNELDSQHVFFAYYYLAELLFFELNSTGEEEILNEIRVLVDNLTKIAEEREMSVAISRSHLLKSKIKILDGNIVEAKKCLNLALNLAVGSNDNRLLHNITVEYDDIFAKEQEFSSIDKATPIRQRIEIAHIDDFVSQFTQQRVPDDDVETEKPILFLIMVDVGTLVYSKSFEVAPDFNENLVSNFIGAINSFGNEIFSSSGFIERINHKDYTILMKPQGIFIFSYIFKGSSFSPSKKLNEISEKIMNFDFIADQDTESRIITMNSQSKQLISTLVESVILDMNTAS